MPERQFIMELPQQVCQFIRRYTAFGDDSMGIDHGNSWRSTTGGKVKPNHRRVLPGG